MKYWIIPMMLVAGFLTILSATWAYQKWKVRGGLKVIFFTDRISKNISLVAVSVVFVCVFAIYFIDSYLLIAENTIGTLPSSIGLFIPVLMFTVLSSVEGRYGKGIYLRVNSVLVPIETKEIEIVKDEVFFIYGQKKTSRFFLSSNRNRESLEFS